MDKIAFSSHVIAVNGMLTSHSNNLSKHHYYLTYHPCLDTQFCLGQTTQRYFRAVAMSSRKKQKRLSCPFVPRRVVKRKKGLSRQNCRQRQRVLLHAAQVRESCAGQLCGSDFGALFISADHVDQKATCIVSYPAYYHSYPATRISASLTALGSLISCPLESVVVA